MARIEIADSFIEAAAALDGADAKRIAAFLDKLIHEPDTAGMHSEMVRDAKDRSMRSMRITKDIRAIAYLGREQVLLLYVAQHDDAYRWARDHCVECHPVTGQLVVVRTAGPGAGGSAIT